MTDADLEAIDVRLGRGAMLLPPLVAPYARSGEGQGRAVEEVGALTVTLGLACAVALALLAGTAGLWGAAAAALVAMSVAVLARRRFGGFTGDVLGATAKLAETAALVVGTAVVA